MVEEYFKEICLHIIISKSVRAIIDGKAMYEKLVRTDEIYSEFIKL